MLVICKCTCFIILLFHLECVNSQKGSINFLIFVQDGFSPLYVASQYGHNLVVDILLKNGANVDQADKV